MALAETRLNRVLLSSRQIECLRWAAAGKSYSDISEIVGIRERTVRYHLVEARERYGFSTIIQAIVQAAKEFDFDPMDARPPRPNERASDGHG